jgi:hypothetical protein
MRTLTLSLKKQWFDMIKSGKKKEEYREIKDHYFHLIYRYAEMQKFFGVPPQPYHFDRPQVFHTKQFQKNFDMLVLRNGYRADSPMITLKNPKIRIGQGKPEWGAAVGVNYFVITWEE